MSRATERPGHAGLRAAPSPAESGAREGDHGRPHATEPDPTGKKGRNLGPTNIMVVPESYVNFDGF